MRRQTLKVIYFTKGGNVTPEDIEAADKISPYCQFRNAAVIRSNEPLEKADAVAGAVPPNYKKAYPTVKSAGGLQMVKDGRLLSPEAKEAASAKEDADPEDGDASEPGDPPVNAPVPPAAKPAWAPNP